MQTLTTALGPGEVQKQLGRARTALKQLCFNFSTAVPLSRGSISSLIEPTLLQGVLIDQTSGRCLGVAQLPSSTHTELSCVQAMLEQQTVAMRHIWPQHWLVAGDRSLFHITASTSRCQLDQADLSLATVGPLLIYTHWQKSEWPRSPEQVRGNGNFPDTLTHFSCPSVPRQVFQARVFALQPEDETADMIMSGHFIGSIPVVLT